MIRTRRPRRGPAARPGIAPRGPESLESRRLMAVFTVTSFADILSPPAGVVTLRSAIQAANASPASDTINLPLAGTYRVFTIGTTTDNTAGEFAIADAGDLTIQNTSGGAVTIDGGGLNRVFDVDPLASAMPFTATFRNVVIQGGVVTGDGAGIEASGAATVTLDHATVQNNVSLFDGAGIAMEPGSTGTLALLASHVLGNRALTSGAGIAARGTGVVAIGSQSEIAENYASDAGGAGIFVAGAPLAIVGAVIRDNQAIDGNGGAIDNVGAGAVSIAGSVVERNVAKNGGGYSDSGLGTLTVLDSFFLNNAAAMNGGGLNASAPAVTLTNTTFSGNGAVLGGGMFVSGTGTVRVTDCSFLGNGGNSSGGIADEAKALVVAGSTFASNRALGSGGAIAAFDTVGDVSISNSLFLNNATDVSGGALYFLGGTLEVAASRFSGNASQSGGAGNLSAKSFSIINTTFDVNTALTAGALSLGLTGTTNALTNDTFFANAAQKDGAINVTGAANTTLTMIDDTLDGNTATATTGGVEQVGGTLVVQGTILAKNTAAGAPSDYTYTGGTLTDSGGNLLGTTAGSGGKFGVGTIIGDPKLAPLVDNGGPTAGAPSTSQTIPTQALFPGSPAFAKGVATGAPTTDGRGFARPAKPAIGAYEPQYASNATPNQVYAENLYEVLFNRPGDAAGVAAAAGYLNGGGTPQGLVQFFQSLDEFVDIEVTTLYRRYFDRAPSASDMTAIAGLLKSGTTPEQVAAAFVGSAEFSQDYGNSNDAFVEASFQTVLGRTPANPAEFSAWDQPIVNGFPRYSVAANMLAGAEYLTNLTTEDFVAYAGRGPTPAELTAYINAAKAGVPSPALAAITLAATFAART